MLATTALSVVRTLAERGKIEGPLGLLAIAVAVISAVIVERWSRTTSGPDPVTGAALCGLFLAIGAVLAAIDVGAISIISRSPLALFLAVGVWLLGVFSIYIALRRNRQDRR